MKSNQNFIGTFVNKKRMSDYTINEKQIDKLFKNNIAVK